jgi:hypothetical protein
MGMARLYPLGLRFPIASGPWVAHISLVFREMWDTTALNPKAFGALSTLEV